jgi:hypothetical protein
MFIVHHYAVDLWSCSHFFCKSSHFITVKSMKMFDFWDVAQSSLDSETLTASIIREMIMETVNIRETSLSFYQTTRRTIPDDSRLHIWYVLE